MAKKISFGCESSLSFLNRELEMALSFYRLPKDYPVKLSVGLDELGKTSLIAELEDPKPVLPVKSCIIIGLPIISKLLRGKEVVIENVVLMPDSQVMNESLKEDL